MVGQAIRTVGFGYIILKMENFVHILSHIESQTDVCMMKNTMVAGVPYAEIVQNIHKYGKLVVLC